MRVRTRILTGVAATAAVGLTAIFTAGPGATSPRRGADDARDHRKPPVEIEVFSPERHHNAGVEGKGWFVDLEARYRGTSLTKAGIDPANPLQLTGPAVHTNAPPFPGAFAPGRDDHLPGLVVLVSTLKDDRPTLGAAAKFQGPGTNVANLFNVTGVTDRTARDFEIWDTWIVGDSIAGKDVDTVLTVAVVADLDHDGAFDDAPNAVTDLNHDGVVNGRDLEALGVASNIVRVPFHINGSPAS